MISAFGVDRYSSAIGQRFGHLTLLHILPLPINRRVAGRFLCRCGAECDYAISRVRVGRPSHCGCETTHVTNLTHGMRYTPEYRAWMGMKGRCLDPGNKDFPRWGGKGVTVHHEWVDSFDSFYQHIGARPSGTSLDRINSLGNYEPDNVRWATTRTQSENRRDSWTVEVGGIRYASIEAAARAHGVTATTVVRWCEGFGDPRRGESRTPPRQGCKRWRTYP